MKVPIFRENTALGAAELFSKIGELDTHQVSDIPTAPAYLPSTGDYIKFPGVGCRAGQEVVGVVSHLLREYDAKGKLEIILK